MLRLMGEGVERSGEEGRRVVEERGGTWHRRDQTTGFLFSSFTGEVIGKLLRFS